MKKYAFTLAEVLITLGIIGVVAALTLPTLIQKYNNGVVETRLKKFYSVYNQAVQMSLVDNNENIENWGFYNAQVWTDGGTIPTDLGQLNDEKFEKYLAPYLKIEKKESIEMHDSVRGDYNCTFYYMADGSAFAFSIWGNGDMIFYPSNPKHCLAKSKRSGVCAFNFLYSPVTGHHKTGKGYEPYTYRWDGNTDSLYNHPTYGCNDSGNGYYCTTVIYQNGWKIPDNYPRKISL